MPSRLAAMATFLPVQGAMLPLGIAGMAVAGASQLATSRRLGVSHTAVEVLKARCVMHVFGMRDDEVALKLARALPNASLAGLGLALFPLWLKRAIDGREAFERPAAIVSDHVPESLGEMASDTGIPILPAVYSAACCWGRVSIREPTAIFALARSTSSKWTGRRRRT